MGIIERQASKSTVFIYIGILIGFFKYHFFSSFLSAEKKGILDAITSTSFLLTSIFTIGLPLVTLETFFQNLEIDQKKTMDLLGFHFLIALVGTFLGIFLS